MNKIIAIVGMCGSGKSVACDLLEKRGYKKVYFGGVTLAKLKEANLEDTPENEKYMREIEELAKSNNVVLDGLYSWDELKILKEKFNTQLNTIAIVVDKSTRYTRLSERIIRALTQAEATKRDISEIENIAKAGPIAYADYYIDNNYTIEDFEKRLDEILKEISREE